MKINLYKDDIPKGIIKSDSVAIDIETMGLKVHRDRLCLVQIIEKDNDEVHIIQFLPNKLIKSPILSNLLVDPSVTKIFHFARFDIAFLMYTLDIKISSIYCTKIASKLARTYTDRHSLKDLCRDLLNLELIKQEQTSDWGKIELTEKQLHYAASDVIYLHKLKNILDQLLERENRSDLAKACFNFLPYKAYLDLMVTEEEFDIFQH